MRTIAERVVADAEARNTLPLEYVSKKSPPGTLPRWMEHFTPTRRNNGH